RISSFSKGQVLSRHRSILDAWIGAGDQAWAQSPIARHMPLILSAAGALGVAPFAVTRWLAGDWPIAIIDTIIVAAFAVLGTYIYRTRKVRGASLLIAVLCVTGTLITVQMRGPHQVYWAYPALMTCFYLLKTREAIALTLTMAAVLFVQLVGEVNFFRVGAILVTLLVTGAFAASFAVLNNRQHEQLLRLATRDPLTGAGNRRAFLSKLSQAIAAFERLRRPSSLVLFDIDHFKQINDAHGHRAGDEILRRFAQRVESRIRLTD